MSAHNELLVGTYVGLVLDTQDPDALGRVKLIVPGKTGPLFKGWNESSSDISFSTVSQKPFTPEILERLLGVLPWARPSTPIWGGGTGAPVNTSTQTSTVVPTEQSLSTNSTGSATPAIPAAPANAPAGTPQKDLRVAHNDGTNNTQGEFTGPVNQVGTDGNCSSNPSGNAITLDQATEISRGLNQQMDSLNQTIVVNNGVMNEASFKAYAVQRLKCSPLLTANIDPAEAAYFQVTDTHSVDQWADFMWRTALQEQSGKISSEGDPNKWQDEGGSHGAWSTSEHDVVRYGGYPKGKYNFNDLDSNPMIAANTAISQVESEVCRNNTIVGLDNSVTKQGSYNHNTLEALAGHRGVLTAAESGRSGGALVQRTTNMGQNTYPSLNMSRYGAPIGNFSIPAAGSKVWVIFEGGSPSRPVYIGQVYEPSNIQAHS